MVLVLVAVLGAGLAGIATVWHTASKREREAELLFVGDQFRKAIASYYDASQGNDKRYPQALDDLLEDKRLPVVKRHLRKVFVDPMTGDTEWGLVKVPGAGIIGVHSLSSDQPLKVAGFPAEYASFSLAKQYSDWVFASAPATPTTAVPAPGLPGDTLGGDRGVQARPRPVAASPPPVPAENISPQEKDEIRKRIEYLCSLEKKADLTVCDEVKSAQGDAAATRCQSSAGRREQVCLRADGSIAPALDAGM